MPSPLRNAPLLPVLIAGLFLVLARLWLVEAQDVIAIAGADYDDQLFVDRAQSLVTGDWLGPYNERTLIKGPFYSFWIAATFLAAVPLLFAQNLLYAAACAVCAFALAPLLRSRWVALSLFGVLLFNPGSFSANATTRVLRSGVDSSLVLFLAACACGLFLRRGQGAKALFGWSVGLGLAMGAFWLNREEAVWILPLLAVTLGGVGLGVMRYPKGRRWLPLLMLLMPLGIWQTCLVAVRLANLQRYGAPVAVELTSREFEAAWGALSRAGASEFQEYVPVPNGVRRRLYELSPSFSELEPYLERGGSGGWTGPGCSWVQVCDDLVGSWALFGVRDAAARAGHHQSAAEAARYYDRLATEVNAACESGEIPCGAPRATLAPVLHGTYLKRWPGRTAQTVATLVRFAGVSVDSWVDEGGSDAQRQLFEVLTRERLVEESPDGDPIRLDGWAFGDGPELAFEVFKEDGSKAQSYYRFRSSPGFYESLYPGGGPPGAQRARFNLWTFCSERCRVDVVADSEVLASFRFDDLPEPIETGRLFLRVNSLELRSAAAVDAKLERDKLAALAGIVRVYGFVVPPFAVLALLALAAETQALVRTRRLEESWLPGSGLLMSVGALAALLALIDLTSFHATVPLYLGPAYPLLLLWTFLMCRQGLRRLAGYWR